MGSISTILDAVIDNGLSGKRVEIGVVDRNEYETIRTRLVTLWTEHRDILLAVGNDADPLSTAALCSDFREIGSAKVGSYYLGKARRKQAKIYSFTIVDSSEPVVVEPANDEHPQADSGNPASKIAE